MKNNFKVDLAKINTNDFNITYRDNRILITPCKSKHTWQDDELHLRSLLCDQDGYVLSSGFPKFENYGKNPQTDQYFLDALKEGDITFTDKKDGSLIIATKIDGKAHFRTRGNFDLGSFEKDVMNLINTKYSNLISWIESPFNMIPGCSFLFEYVSPTNQIVLKYPEAKLYFLGAIWLDKLKYHRPDIQDEIGIEPVETFNLDNSEDTIQEIKKWNDREGVVVQFYVPQTQERQLLKIKSDLYLKLHTLKFNIAGKVKKLAYLLDITDLVDSSTKLESIGIDWEGQQYIQSELEEYIIKYNNTITKFNSFTNITIPNLLREADQKINKLDSPKEYRSHFVKLLKLGGIGIDNIIFMSHVWFSAAMSIYDGNIDKARVQVIANEILDEPTSNVLSWAKNRQQILSEMLKISDLDEDI